MNLLGTGLAVALIILAFIVLILGFELWMLVSVIQNRKVSDTAKVLWVLGMLFIHPFVAMIYYFTDYQKTRQK